uniref:Adenosylmethionine-8-amino-7-oxononanoate aminotransferase (EC) n=1 Tax=uncultured Thiotrichaceae bacterium TaxID=298394 RepID=A0A6S6U3E0_9GAMM|nr:MAG: Adenosylmethionine-8-amino-7-oxononanoate aminotransferase (EC [uncultured Thiotrichaceae bacterium]
MKQVSHVFPRHTKVSLPVAVSGEGCYLFDSTGKQYLDACGGAAVSCLGHSDQFVKEAIKAQIDELPFVHSGFFTSDPTESLANLLVKYAPEGIERVYFVSGGSEAVEAALKLARQYFLEKGEPQRTCLIARRQSYHGNTLGALATGGNEWRRKPFKPLMIDTTHISPCYAYRGQQSGESEYDYGQRVANELEDELLRLGPDTVIAFLAEPVVGATLGAVPAVKGYFRRIREICDQYGVLLILDEVMCGMGRTGTLFACEQDGISPDIVTIAKGLGAGYQSLGAMLCSGEIYAAIEQGSGFFQHGHTYMGHATACAAGEAVLTTLLERQLVEQVNAVGDKLDQALRAEFSEHPFVGDLRGRGLFRGIELVADKATKAPLNTELATAKRVKQAACELGLMCYPMSRTIDGERGDHVLLAPPFIFDDSHIDELLTKLKGAFDVISA